MVIYCALHQEKKLEWGKGLAQKREAETKQQELELEKDKPFARTRDDPELDKILKDRVRWGDPMAHLVKRKNSELILPDLGDGEKMKESGFIIPQEIPSHSWIKRGLDAAPNRYGIRPGRHWDGVDRSTVNGNLSLRVFLVDSRLSWGSLLFEVMGSCAGNIAEVLRSRCLKERMRNKLQREKLISGLWQICDEGYWMEYLSNLSSDHQKSIVKSNSLDEDINIRINVQNQAMRLHCAMASCDGYCGGTRVQTLPPTVRLSSISLEKFLKSRKNLFKAPPRLWSDHGHGLPEEDDQPLPILKLSHPILRTLESCCGSTKEFNQIHTQLIVSGLLQQPLAAGRAVKTLCSFPDSVQHAVSLFEGLEEPDAFICNTIMRTYVNVNDPYTALGFYYEQMFVGELGMQEQCLRLFYIGFGYVGNGDMTAAEDLFSKMPFRDIVSWNCMIDGYAQFLEYHVGSLCADQRHDECLRMFDKMMGRLCQTRLPLVIEPDVLLSTALLTMYAKCGAMDLARDVFDKMPNRSVVSWNSMIMDMACQADKALEMFLDMEKRGPMPNDATFICVLSACAHSGMILEGWWYFDLMRQVYKIEPKVEHYGCMVDLLGRAGLMKDSEELIRRMPMEGGTALWGALLSACRTHSNSELAEIVAKRLVELEPRDIGPYLLLSNIYAAEGKWDDVEIVRMMMKERGLTKTTGFSRVHIEEFGTQSFVEDASVHRKSMMYSILSDMATRMKLSCGDYDEVENLTVENSKWTGKNHGSSGDKDHTSMEVHPTATYRVKNDTWPDSISKGAPKCVKNSGSLSCMSGSNMVAISLGSKHLSLLSNLAKKADLHKPVQLGDQSRSK
ncbi:Pentatricopeptide repeat-containing protein [Vitis vinifera]|uniref:Pentatricopeptide repeat-containing protein n=1 Tax=Vitis vinifera TaxID=29760 RepID=A0A438IUF8_VITVI|nr:Pentatricopeptide repeat-containing protein [Vitis vinifera]